jgi:hypothetical protein
VYSPIVAKQRLGKNVNTATNTSTIEVLEALFSMWSVPYHRKLVGYFFPEFLFIYMRCDTEPLGTLMRNGPIVPVHDGKDDKM